MIAGSGTSNHPAGTLVTARLHAESGTSHVQTSGAYNVTLVATATAL